MTQLLPRGRVMYAQQQHGPYACQICRMWHCHCEDQVRHSEMALRATVAEVTIDG